MKRCCGANLVPGPLGVAAKELRAPCGVHHVCCMLWCALALSESRRPRPALLGSQPLTLGSLQECSGDASACISAVWAICAVCTVFPIVSSGHPECGLLLRPVLISLVDPHSCAGLCMHAYSAGVDWVGAPGSARRWLSCPAATTHAILCRHPATGATLPPHKTQSLAGAVAMYCSTLSRRCWLLELGAALGAAAAAHVHS